VDGQAPRHAESLGEPGGEVGPVDQRLGLTAIVANLRTSGGTTAKNGERSNRWTCLTNSLNSRGPAPASAVPVTQVREAVVMEGTS
jgi:hypothetical protein